MGDLVRLRGLQKAVWNHHMGRVTGFLHQRVAVALHGALWPCGAQRRASFKPENLQRMQLLDEKLDIEDIESPSVCHRSIKTTNL